MSAKKNDKRLKVNTVSTGILFFGFALIVLVTPAVGQAQKVLAYVYLMLSVILAIWALLPRGRSNMAILFVDDFYSGPN